ncbi:AAA domain-containing protein [Actinacidiphila oryziradicis]|uniref:AAA domain-containing protein n=1 Tax=Actinacidiphila oryziradicis TaxID=2571141 RepID=UPI001B8027CE|nr:AAA domain-containing protein [Actinacidiphila oryziradicis]
MAKQRLQADDAATTVQLRNLIEYLRAFVRTAHKPVRDCGQLEDVLWLSGLPDSVPRPRATADGILMKVDHRPRRPAPQIPKELTGWLSPEVVAQPTAQEPELAETGPGRGWVEDENGEWIEVDWIRREDAAEVLSAYTRWLPLWGKWSSIERANDPHRKLHRRLRRIARRMQEEGDVYEAVLAVGLLSGGQDHPDGRVRRHLLTAPVVFTVKPDTVEITVALVPDAPLRLEDRDFLDEEDGYSSELLAALRTRVEGGDLHPLSPEIEGVLAQWCDRAMGEGRTVRFTAAWDQAERTRSSEPGLQVLLAPALVLRERGRSAITGFYEAITRELSRPGAVSPLGLAQLLQPLEAPERLAWASAGGGPVQPALGPDPLFPLRANAAQRRVLHRLQQDTGVVVQGPPGTGKTHTIANLVCALLADGKRVLVTSEKDQALRVLRDQLPDELRELCVLQTDARSGGAEDVERSVRALSNRASTTSPQQLAESIEDLSALRRRLSDEAAGLRDELRALREAEWYEHPEVAPGYRGRLAEIVEAVAGDEERFGWLPALPAGAPDAPSVTADEARRILAIVARHGRGVLDDIAARCPDPDDLPTPEEFAAAVARVKAAEEARAQAGADSVADQIAGHGPELVGVLREHMEQAVQVLQRQGLSVALGAWDSDSWQSTALSDLLARKRSFLWDQIRNASRQAEQTRQALLGLNFAHVGVPEGLGAAETSRLVCAGQALQEYLVQNKPLHKRFKTAVEKEAKDLLERCTVDGRAPRTAAEVGAAVAHLQARLSVEQLSARWADVGAPAPGGPVAAVLSELLDRIAVLGAITAFADQAAAVRAALEQARIPVSVQKPQEWQDVRASTVHALDHLAAQQAQRDLEQLSRALPAPTARSVPELAVVHRAAADRDPQAYQDAVTALTRAYTREADRREARKLLERLEAEHPQLARLLGETPSDSAWAARLEALEAAWAWRRARAFVEQMLVPGREGVLEARLDEAEEHLQDTVKHLAAAHALRHCLLRMSAAQRQALSAYATAMSNAGKGTSALSRRHLKAARSAMRVASGAVPAWVMPVKQVAQLIAPERDSFDVVIVDEASQVGLEGVMLLWLAPRVVIVGDDQQCAPAYTGGKHDRLNQRFDELFPDMEHWQREGFSPKSNLYALLTQTFSQVIRLTEHFRCMPEIIHWSSGQFYNYELQPLRQYGADRLTPLKVVHVPNGHCEGFGDRLFNRPEAERIVATLKELTADPAYAKRTFGVVVLRSGGAQVRLIEDLIDTELDAPVRERHEIRVGTPAQFQGDERDVILLSMVIDQDHTRALTSLGDGRRLNVAASRARDQMWLFSSVTTDQLSSSDLRHNLLTYMQSTPALQHTPPELADVTPHTRQDPFQSLFEQRVFLRIRERGYHVVPQWRANGKLIDLVVVGEKGRLAVECDGSPYHSTSQQIRDDYERERELRRAGWRFWRVRSSEFALNPDRALEPLWQRLGSLGIQPGARIESVADAQSTWAPITLADDTDETGDEADDVLAGVTRGA